MTDFQNINGGKTGIDNDKLEAMRASLRGSLLMPADEGYDVSRTLWNAMIDRHPAAIVRAAGAGDVMQTVNFARENKLLLAVRSGGHNIAGKAACDGGLMLDLSAMKSVRVDPAARRARVEPGALLSDFDRETQAFGLSTPTGINSTTGMSGLTLGRRFRLAEPQARVDHRQPSGCRCCIGLGRIRADQRHATPGPVLGTARWWR